MPTGITHHPPTSPVFTRRFSPHLNILYPPVRVICLQVLQACPSPHCDIAASSESPLTTRHALPRLTLTLLYSTLADTPFRPPPDLSIKHAQTHAMSYPSYLYWHTVTTFPCFTPQYSTPPPAPRGAGETAGRGGGGPGSGRDQCTPSKSRHRKPLHSAEHSC
eukprot:3264991-Rhodomonas_salina.1